MTQNFRLQRIEQKFKEEQSHIRYLINHGWTPLDIADQQTHFLIFMLKEQIVRKHPGWTQTQILQELRRLLNQNKTLFNA